jgi:hypothetical protein
MKTYLKGIWEHKLVSLVEMREKFIKVRKINEFLSSFQTQSDKEREAFLHENVKSLADIYLLLGMVLRDKEELIKKRAELLNKTK